MSPGIASQRRPPPFGKALFQRLRFNNPPLLVVVCVGEGAFDRARGWSASPNDCTALVLPDAVPTAYTWPVSGAPCLIDFSHGPSEYIIAQLALALHKAGATGVTSRCAFESGDDWDNLFNLKTGNWDRQRHGLHFYRFDARSPSHARPQ